MSVSKRTVNVLGLHRIIRNAEKIMPTHEAKAALRAYAEGFADGAALMQLAHRGDAADPTLDPDEGADCG